MVALNSLVLFALTAACSDGGDDSSPTDEADADADTDSDTDADTDSDTDADPVRTIDGSLHVVVTDPAGTTTLCDTTVDLTGVETAGACLACDFTLDVEADVASEKGTDCNYDLYPFSMLVEGAQVADTWLGWSDTYTSLSNVLWFGFGLAGYPGPYWQYVLAYDGNPGGTAVYGSGTLDWTLAYTQNDYLGTLAYCGPYLYTPYSDNYGGSYTATGSLDCGLVRPYESWTFQGVDDDFAYITVDTTSSSAAFNPGFYVSDGDDCFIGAGNESFACAFPDSASDLCPSLKLPTDKGETYTVRVETFSPCDAATGDYAITLGTKGDPSLTHLAAGDLTPVISRVTVDAQTTVTEQ